MFVYASIKRLKRVRMIDSFWFFHYHLKLKAFNLFFEKERVNL